MSGTLILVGGNEFTEECSVEESLAERHQRVLIVPTAAAFEDPNKMVAKAQQRFDGLGVGVDVLEVYARSESASDALFDQVAAAEVIYLTSGSPQHLRSVFKDSELFKRIVGAFLDGVTLVIAGEAMPVMCEHMPDQRGGGFTLGLEFITGCVVAPYSFESSPELWHRLIELGPQDIPIVGIEDSTALILDSNNEWSLQGPGSAHVFVAGQRQNLSELSTDIYSRNIE